GIPILIKEPHRMKTLPYLATAIVAGALAFPATAGPNRADGQIRESLRAEDDATAAICNRVRDLQPPSADYPDPATVAMLGHCESADLYYGIGMTADPV